MYPSSIYCKMGIRIYVAIYESLEEWKKKNEDEKMKERVLKSKIKSFVHGASGMTYE